MASAFHSGDEISSRSCELRCASTPVVLTAATDIEAPVVDTRPSAISIEVNLLPSAWSQSPIRSAVFVY
jgi:hypothetical protein